jgi:hypothetical protein
MVSEIAAVHVRDLKVCLEDGCLEGHGFSRFRFPLIQQIRQRSTWTLAAGGHCEPFNFLLPQPALTAKDAKERAGNPRRNETRREEFMTVDSRSLQWLIDPSVAFDLPSRTFGSFAVNAFDLR